MCPLKLLCATLHATVAEVESAPTSAISCATVSPCVHHLQHCVQLRDAMLGTMMHHVSRPLQYVMGPSRPRIILIFSQPSAMHLG